MRNEHVIAVFKAFLDGQPDRAVQLLQQVEAGEKAAGRHHVAERIRRLMTQPRQMISLPTKAPNQIRMIAPTRSLDSVVLSTAVADSVAKILDEWRYRTELLSHGLTLRSTIILHGPSGNGKTCLAQAIAHAVGLPLALVDYGSMIDSHLGVTGSNIAGVMKWVQTTPCVLLFDEADSLVESRRSDAYAADRECNRAVNQVLVEIDALQSRSLVIFATNRIEEIDGALLRRMAFTLEMPAPDDEERHEFVTALATKWPDIDISPIIGPATRARSFAECEELVVSCVRERIIRKAKEKVHADL